MTDSLRDAVAAAVHPAIDEGTDNFTVPWDVVIAYPDPFSGTLEIAYAVADAALNAALEGLAQEVEADMAWNGPPQPLIDFILSRKVGDA